MKYDINKNAFFYINVYIRWNTSRSSDSFYIFRILMPEGRGICSKKIILLKGKSCIFWLNVLGIDLMHLWISVRCWWCLLSFNKSSNNLMKQFLWHYRAMSHYKLEMAIWTIHQNKDCYIQIHIMVMIYALKVLENYKLGKVTVSNISILQR